MIRALHTLKHELRPMLQLAGPVVLAELGWMSMGLVDTMMVGRVSAEALGGVAVGGILFYAVVIFGAGLLLGLDTLVSQSFGAGDLDDCRRSLLNSVYLLLPLAPLLIGVLLLGPSVLRALNLKPEVVREAVPYLDAIIWSVPAQLLYFAFRRYLQGMNLVRGVTLALITANLVNAAVNWILIFGHLGAPAMGAAGAGWATTLSRYYMAGFLLVCIALKTGPFHTGLRPDLARIRRLLQLGLPASAQLTLEVGVFALATALIGKLDAVSLAAHQIALNLASFTFMVPLGVSSAGAVRVGQALGRGDPVAAGRSGWTALALGAGFMACGGLAFLLAPEFIAGLFTTDRAVIKVGASLLVVAAFFQLFDGIQVVVTGNLRGAGDTRTPAICHLVGYWVLGLPVGYVLCFPTGWGAVGLWIGLSLALISMGSVLLVIWSRRVRSLALQGRSVTRSG